MNNQNLAIKIKDLRNRKGLSQEQLSEESKLSLRTIQRIEKGESIPRGDTLMRLTQALGITPDELLDWAKIEDKGFLTLLNLSALSFVIHPILGIIIPMVMWILKKEKIKFADDLGRKLISFQISWTLLFYIILIVISIIYMKHFTLMLNIDLVAVLESTINKFSFYSLLIIILYSYNILLIFMNTRRIQKGIDFKYLPTIPFLK